MGLFGGDAGRAESPAGGAAGFPALPPHAGAGTSTRFPGPCGWAGSFVPKQGVAIVTGSQQETSGSPELTGFL